MSINFLRDFLNNKDIVSEYSHQNYIDKMGDKQFFHMDCSGFVYWYLVQMKYKKSLAELRRFLKKHNFIKINRFFCKDFTFIYEHQNEFNYWQFTERPTTKSILVIIFKNGHGHCMFVDKIIRNDKDKLLLRIIDSTRYPHKNDNRQATGIGSGEIELIYKNKTWFYNSNNPNLPIREAQIYFVNPVK